MGLGIIIAVNGNADPKLMDATRVEVLQRMGQATNFHIRYDMEISVGDLPLLVNNQFGPGAELSVTVPTDESTFCLVKGPIHGQHIHVEHGGSGSWLEVNGSDSTVLMDRVTQSAVWSDVKDSDVIFSILGTYGLTPDVETTSSIHVEDKHALIQRESDLGFIRRLARRNGFQFWVTCNEMGLETAHFKRPELDGEPVTELVINLPEPNLFSLDINWDVERPTSMEGKQLDLNTKTDIEVAVAQTPQTILGDNSLGDITGDTHSVHLSAPVNDAGDLQARGEGAVLEADWFIRASCQTTLEKLGTLIRSHEVVAVQGAGSRYSGNYFVAGVRHTIDDTEHLMDIELIRNGWNG